MFYFIASVRDLNYRTLFLNQPSKHVYPVCNDNQMLPRALLCSRFPGRVAVTRAPFRNASSCHLLLSVFGAAEGKLRPDVGLPLKGRGTERAGSSLAASESFFAATLCLQVQVKLGSTCSAETRGFAEVSGLPPAPEPPPPHLLGL